MAVMERLERTVFETSRMMEFCTQQGLEMQTGATTSEWPLIIIKELMDNALDACENASTAPAIDVYLKDTERDFTITIDDNGPGLKPDVINKILNFATKTSDKEAYISPTRGAQGNALKTILTIPYVLSRANPKTGTVVFESCGLRHTVTVKVDAIRNQPVIEPVRDEICKNSGTKVIVSFEKASINSFYWKNHFLQILQKYPLWNPHLTLTVTFEPCQGDIQKANYPASNGLWRKWRPNDTTSPLWYTVEDLQRLIAAYIANAQDGGRDLTLREFVSQFRGLASTAKQKEITSKIDGIKRLSDFVNSRDIRADKIAELLNAMKAESKPVPPEALGIIGKDHFKRFFNADKITYSCKTGKEDIPFVVEAAYIPVESNETPFFFGLNFSPLAQDPFANIDMGQGDERQYQHGIYGLSQLYKVTHGDPAIILAHVTYPHFRFQDKGKNTVVYDESSQTMYKSIAAAMDDVLKEHKAYKDKLERDRKTQERQAKEEQKAIRSQQLTIKDAVFAVLPEAARRASGDYQYPYSVRQLYYQVRPLLQAIGNVKSDKLEYSYFTPPLVTEYEDTHGPLRGLVYDARGHLIVPHNTTEEIPLGTTEVDSYSIPEWEYNKILYIEKEGFKQIFKQQQLGQRFDMALMTGKGYSTRAAKQLCYNASGKNISILVAHDADLYGYEIARTLRDATRTSRGMTIDIIDFGLKVEEALAMGLEPEDVTVEKAPSAVLFQELTEFERNFFYKHDSYNYPGEKSRGRGKRIELNAMTTDQLVSWIETKLTYYQLNNKVLPPHTVTESKYKDDVIFQIDQKADELVKEILENLVGDLKGIVKQHLGEPSDEIPYNELQDTLKDCPADSWSDIVEGYATKAVSNLVRRERDKVHDDVTRLLQERLGR